MATPARQLSIGLSLIALGLVACASAPSAPSKLRFELGGIRADGLVGPADGLVAVDYEFCVPAEPAILAEVRRLDSTIQISLVSRGRIGRREGQALCLGNTHQAHWRQVLESLAALPYITEIRRCYFE